VLKFGAYSVSGLLFILQPDRRRPQTQESRDDFPFPDFTTAAGNHCG